MSKMARTTWERTPNRTRRMVERKGRSWKRREAREATKAPPYWMTKDLGDEEYSVS